MMVSRWSFILLELLLFQLLAPYFSNHIKGLKQLSVVQAISKWPVVPVHTYCADFLLLTMQGSFHVVKRRVIIYGETEAKS